MSMDKISNAVPASNPFAKTVLEILSGFSKTDLWSSADLKVAQAMAEERRAAAVATEQEMKAKAQEARAKVIEAEAQIPLAIAEAFKSGKLGVMDYYKMQNIQADTSMRDTIAKNPLFPTVRF